eukprot:GHVQ01018817.1.p1 GENE.GHVQ01018817.1~~GHVQ01018817.1.p1  ORF type:complete len:819 (+),score=79.95 GHVQ01018817.1:207-2663(+)
MPALSRPLWFPVSSSFGTTRDNLFGGISFFRATTGYPLTAALPSRISRGTLRWSTQYRFFCIWRTARNGSDSCLSSGGLLSPWLGQLTRELLQHPFLSAAPIRNFASIFKQRVRSLASIPSWLLTKPPKGFEKFYPKKERDGDFAKEGRDDDGRDRKKSPGGGRFPQLDPKSIVLLGAVGSLLVLSSVDTSGMGNEITYQEFVRDYLSHGYVSRIQVVNNEFCRVIVRADCPKAGQHVSFRLATAAGFEPRLEQFQAGLGIKPRDNIPVQYVKEFSYLREVKAYIPTIVTFLVISFFIQKLQLRGAGGGVDKFLKMGKATPVSAKDMKSRVKFADVAGMVHAKKEIMEFVEFLKDPKRFEYLGARVPKGALLCGPPGTGKTLLAKAVAGEASVPFFTMSGSDFIEVFVGVGPSRVRDLFSQARKHAPSIIFIDEIDAVGRKRGRGGFAGGGTDERESTLNQLLVEMDGFTKSAGVVVLAGTNRIDILDPALLRPGRFDRTVNIEVPDLEERTAIFKVHLRPLRLMKDLNMEEVARRLASLSPGCSGAEIENVCNEAAIMAARRHSVDGVDERDFEQAAERVMGGLPKTNLMNKEQRRRVAYHEAGHALVGWMLKHADPVLKVSIVPRGGGALGFAQILPENISLYTREALLDKIAVILGGRAAEEVVIGGISTGAVDDLKKVTRLSYAFVSEYGMSDEVGMTSYSNNDPEGRNFYKPYSEVTAQVIDQEVKSLISSQYLRAKDLLTEKVHLLHRLADVLATKETIAYNDILEAVGERPFPMSDDLATYVMANPKKLCQLEDPDPLHLQLPLLLLHPVM